MAVSRRLREMPAKAELARLFQVDMSKPAEHLEMSEDLVALVQDTVTHLFRFFGSATDPLGDMKDRFEARYGNETVELRYRIENQRQIVFELTARPKVFGGGATDKTVQQVLSELKFDFGHFYEDMVYVTRLPERQSGPAE